MGALDMGLNEEELQPLVTAWRAANPNITRLWWDVDRAAKTAVRKRPLSKHTTSSLNTAVDFSLLHSRQAESLLMLTTHRS